ncbi:MAG TPA: hypothetical protein VJN95_08855 [Gemmatimonadales bacterium]|nr:hypothetical protein [Gemmatimonadales bacterium]
MPDPALQELPAARPPRPLKVQFGVDIDLNAWIEQRSKQKDQSVSEFVYDVVAAAFRADRAA